MIDISEQIQFFLREYIDGVHDEIEEIAEQTAKETVKFLKKDSPKNTGAYAKGWKAKKVDGFWTVHNPKHYRLTHILEKGHLDASGTKRIAPQKHIEPVEEKMVKKYVSDVMEAVSK